MDLFNIIAGTASIISLFISLFVASKVININNNVNMDSSKKVNQRVKGDGNTVSAGDVNNV